MKIRDLIEALSKYPDDATVTAFDADADGVAEVTGLLFNPTGSYLVAGEDGDSGEVINMPTLQICTDD